VDLDEVEDGQEAKILRPHLGGVGPERKPGPIAFGESFFPKSIVVDG